MKNEKTGLFRELPFSHFYSYRIPRDSREILSPETIYMQKKTEFAATRREGRILCFQSLYSYEVDKTSLDELLKFKWLEEPVSDQSIAYAKKIITGTINNLDKIDDLIKEKLINWNFDRISLVDKSILRFSVYSMLFAADPVPAKVIINEAVEIVKKFGADDSYKFINGILDAIKKTQKPGS